MKRWLPLIALATAQFVMVLDQSVMNVSISTLVDDFDTTVTTIQAVITFYCLVMAMFMLTGAKIKLVQQCSGIDGMWGLRAENAGISVSIAGKLADQVRRADGEAIAGDCHLANTAITEQTGDEPVHPLQLIARAYGISEEIIQR